MKVFEILKFNREPLDRLRMAGIRLDDARFVDLYTDYAAMLADGNKVTYTMAVLARKYGVSERKAYSLVRRFKADCGQDVFGGVKSAPTAANALQRKMAGRRSR